MEGGEKPIGNSLKTLFLLERFILVGSALSFLQSATRMVISLVTVPLTIGYLGNERYGLWMATLSTLSVISLMDLGIMPVLKNFLSESFAKNDERRFIRYSSGGIGASFLLLFVGIIASPLLYMFDWASIFNATESITISEATPLAVSVYYMGLLTLSLNIVDSIYAARMELEKLQKVGICCSIVSLFLLWFAIYFRSGLVFLAVVVSLPNIASRLWLFVTFVYKNRLSSLLEIRNTILIIRELVPLSIPFIGIKVAEIILAALPSLIIANALNLSEVSIYSVALRLTSIPLVFLTGVLPIFWPAFSAAWARGEITWLKRSLFFLISITVIIFIICAVANTVGGSAIIKWWTGGKVKPTWSFMLVLSLSVAIQATVYWISTFLHSISDFRFEFLCFSGAALILLTSAFIVTEKAGLIGLCIVISIAWGVSCLIPMALRVRAKLSLG